jgi:hypothetical protein
VASVLGDLIGKEVTVMEGNPLPLGPDIPFCVVLFRDDQGGPGAIMLCDLATSIYTGAALTVMPPETAREAVDSKTLDDNMFENFKEVMNILGGSLFNSPDTPHLVLREIWMTPAKLPSELEPLFTQPSERADMDLTIEEYGDGKLTLLTV